MPEPAAAHQERLDVDAYDDEVPVPWFGPRMVCKCGIIGADARPKERATAERKPSWQAVALTGGT